MLNEPRSPFHKRKIVVRGIPPAISEEKFWNNILGEWSRYLEYHYFVSGRNSYNSRAYFVFKDEGLTKVGEFCFFVHSLSLGSSISVEVSPFQGYSASCTVDSSYWSSLEEGPKEGQDEMFDKFMCLSAVETVACREDVKEPCKITPLIAYLQQQTFNDSPGKPKKPKKKKKRPQKEAFQVSIFKREIPACSTEAPSVAQASQFEKRKFSKEARPDAVAIKDFKRPT